MKTNNNSLTLAISSQQSFEGFRRIERLIPLIVITLVLIASKASAQQYNISEIVTDFGGYWKSGVGTVNTIKPDSNHNLLSFTYSGVRYSTGVDDAKLASKGLSFIAGDYKALPVQTLSAANGSTKIGLGARTDGNLNGAGSSSISANLIHYLTDGPKGLDIGTCVANLPSSDMFLPVSNVKISTIGDNIPDLVITQTADPSNSLDRYEFTDINGNRIGNYVDINLTNIPPVGNWMADFYDANQNPPKLTNGYTNTERAIRLWAADFSAFGINASNINQVAYFKIKLNGNSDVAFVAYNQMSIEIANAVLPVTLTAFSAKAAANNVQLNWSTAAEMNSNRFVVEMSMDGSKYFAVDSVKAAGVSHRALNYGISHNPGVKGAAYYRLKQIDNNGNFEYSKTVTVNFNPEVLKISTYPNPATTFTTVNHPAAKGTEKLLLFNVNGVLVQQKSVAKNSIQTRLEFSNLPAGTYHAVIASENERASVKIILQ